MNSRSDAGDLNNCDLLGLDYGNGSAGGYV